MTLFGGALGIDDIRQAAARLEGVALRTPLLSSAYLDERLAARVFIKPECLQHIGAFKFRGAYNRMSQLSATERAQGAVAYSSGNHAQGVAYAARLLGMQSTIVMPTDAPEIKIQGTEKLGATIRLYDRQSESREQIAEDIARSTGAVLIPAFDDSNIIAGQGTCGLELMQQLAERDCVPDTVLSPCGGGGLMAGVSTAIKAISPGTRVIGVEPENFDDHFKSKQAGRRVKISGTAATMCDALMATTPGEITWSINRRTVDDFVVVSEDDVAYAVAYACRYLKLVVEPGGAVALAALLRNRLDVGGESVAIILSGGNIDKATLVRCLDKYPLP